VLAAIELQLEDIRTQLRDGVQPVGLEDVQAQLTQIRSALSVVSPAEGPPIGDAVRAAEDLRRALSDQLADVRAQLAEERAGRDAWLQSVAHRLAGRLLELSGSATGAESQAVDFEPVLAEIRALGRTVSGAASAMDRGPEMNELRDLVMEAAGKVVPEELVVLQRAISDLSAREASSVGIEAVVDDVDTMRKEIGERLGNIESALDELRAALLHR
jgi:hypothetical protein